MKKFLAFNNQLGTTTLEKEIGQNVQPVTSIMWTRNTNVGMTRPQYPPDVYSHGVNTAMADTIRPQRMFVENLSQFLWSIFTKTIIIAVLAYVI